MSDDAEKFKAQFDEYRAARAAMSPEERLAAKARLNSFYPAHGVMATTFYDAEEAKAVTAKGQALMESFRQNLDAGVAGMKAHIEKRAANPNLPGCHWCGTLDDNKHVPFCYGAPISFNVDGVYPADPPKDGDQ